MTQWGANLMLQEQKDNGGRACYSSFKKVIEIIKMRSKLDVSCNMINYFMYNPKNIPKDINVFVDNASVSGVTNVALLLNKPMVSTLTDSNKVGNVIKKKYFNNNKVYQSDH